MRDQSRVDALACGCVMRWHEHYDSRGKRDPSGDAVMVISECGSNHKEAMLSKQRELEAA